MGLKILIIFFLGFVIGSPSEAGQKKDLVVKIKLVKCSKTSGGMYREEPPEAPFCRAVGSKFLILHGCKNKFDTRTCGRVLKMHSKTGFKNIKLSAGLYHFVWDSTSPELRQQGPCSVRIDDAYDIEIKKADQEVRLAVDEHCAAP